MAKVHILSLDGTSIDQTHWHETKAQAERYFRAKWKWCEGLTIAQYE
jgi:hypothetical protein